MGALFGVSLQGGNGILATDEALAPIVDLDKLLSAVMAPLHAVLSHWDMAGAATEPAMSVARDEFLAPHDLSLETAVCFWNR